MQNLIFYAADIFKDLKMNDYWDLAQNPNPNETPIKHICDQQMPRMKLINAHNQADMFDASSKIIIIYDIMFIDTLHISYACHMHIIYIHSI